MDVAETILAEFGRESCGAPCSESDLARAEQLLGAPLPNPLRMLYLAFDGFRGPTDARFLYPLFARDGLVDFNRFLRNGEDFPKRFVTSCLFFGDPGSGELWGLKSDLPTQVIRWNAAWGEDYEIAGATPLEVWLAQKKIYDGIEKRG